MSSRHGAPFFADGLRFDCTRCQRCCRIDPGVVLMSQNDLDQLSPFLDLPEGEVRERYAFVSDLRLQAGEEILIETAGGGGWGSPRLPSA